MNLAKKKTIRKVCVALILALAMLLGCMGIIFGSSHTADAFVGSKVASQSTNLGELLRANYDDGKGNVINETMFWQLIHQISGVDNPNEKTLESLTTTTSAGFRTLNGNDVVVTIGGKKWTATYLSRNTSGDPILTLWLASSSTEAQWNGYSSEQDVKYPSDMYGTSRIRALSLNNGGGYASSGNAGQLTTATQNTDSQWAIYTMDKSKKSGSIKEFIEVPSNMSWQSSQNAREINGTNYSYNNDGLDSGASGPTDVVSYVGKEGYTNWGNDKLWLPSVTEVGSQDESKSGLWKTSMNQRETDNNKEFWFRSAYPQSNTVYGIGGEGLWNFFQIDVTSSYYLRPAFHLNLNAVIDSFSLDEPVDVSNPYTGATQSLSNIADTTKTSWFDNTKMRIDYPSPMKDARIEPYKVKVTITSEGDKFKGTPDTSDPEHLESDTVRYFNFTITKKKISVTISTDGKTVNPSAGAICADDVGKEERLPILSLSYTTPGGVPLDKYPTAAGENYVATASITNECNYEIDTSNIDNYTKKFNVMAKNVDKPTVVGSNESEYIGEDIGFAINASSDVTLTPLDGLVRKADGKFYAKTVGTYKIRMTLVDDEVAKQWTDLKNSQIREDLEVKITPATLKITFNGDVWSWNRKTEQTVTFSDNRIGSDKLSFNVSYDSTAISDVTTDHTAKTTTVKIPPLDVKTYSLKVSIKPSNDDDSKNYKITGDVAQRSFSVGDKEIEVKESNIKWKYSINHVGSNDVGNWTTGTPFSALQYDGREYYFDAILDGIDDEDSVTVSQPVTKNSSGEVVSFGKDADTYTTTITLSSDKVKFKDNKNTFTLTWKIDKGLFDLTQVKWNYTKPLLFNDKEQEVVMTGIPEGLTFAYYGNKKRAVADNYSAKVTSITVADSYKSNYKTPVIPTTGTTSDTYKGEVEWTLNWKIKKGELELEWTPKQEKDVNDKVYSCWESSNHKDKIEYRYYTVEAYADGALTGAPTDKANIIVPDEEKEIEYYIVAIVKASQNTNYEIVGKSAMPFVVGSLATVIDIKMADKFTYDTKAHGKEWYDADVAGMEYVSAQYFKVEEDGSETSLGDTPPTDAGNYIVRLSVDEEYITSYQLSKIKVDYSIAKAQIEITQVKGEYDYDGQGHAGEFSVTTDNYDVSKIEKTYYKGDTKDFPLANGKLPCDADDYLVVLALPDKDSGNYEIKAGVEFGIKINKAKITVKWVKDDNGIPSLSELTAKQKDAVGYLYYDENGEELDSGATLEVGKSYKVKAILTGNNGDNYVFVAEDGETVLEDPEMTDEQDFTVKDSGNGQGGNVGIGSGDGSGNQGGTAGGTVDFGDLLGKLQGIPLWQLIAIIISIILTIIFLSKTASYDSKRKKFNKKSDKLEKMYAAAPFLGIASSIWTAIACVLMGLAVISFVMMMISKSRCAKAEEEYEDRLTEYNRNQKDLDERKRDENMRMMLMGIMGGSASGGQGGYMGGAGFGLEDMRGLISETVTAMLPGVQQMLPQQASSNDELVEKLIEQNAQTEKRVEKLMSQLAEKPAERQVASANISEEVLEKIASRLQPASNNETILKVVEKTEHNDETIKQLLKNQEILMEKIIDLSNRKPEEKIVEKEVIKEVPVEVEKIVEKEVIKEVPIEVEKVVEKVVEQEDKTVASKIKREVAQKSTLDEAYAMLSKQQQKYFDGLRKYALSKDKCKEKKSTYFTVFGATTTNPLLKLTIKKDTVVALLKMEDEFMKDLRRDASGDGTKVKVKETEIVISDAQAFETAKKMIDLREDQIERYADLLKEQKSLSKRK